MSNYKQQAFIAHGSGRKFKVKVLIGSESGEGPSDVSSCGKGVNKCPQASSQGL